MNDKKSNILPQILCVLVLLSSAMLPLVTATSPVEIYGYIHLDDSQSVSQLSNHLIIITDDSTQISQQVYTDQYGFFTTVLQEPHGQYGLDTLSIDVSFYDPINKFMIDGSTTMTLSPFMRADPTFTLFEQECNWYEDENAPITTYPPHSDQIITDLYFSRDFVFEGESVTIFADVNNIGDANLMQSTSVRFYEWDTLILPGDIEIPVLPVDETEIIQIIWVPGSAGTHMINVAVGEADVFPEVNMDNNIDSENFIVLTFIGDYDLDGLTNWDEYSIYGTCPINADTDDDGLPDGWEVGFGLSPLNDGRIDPIHGPNGDQDGDGLINLDEYSNSFDSDGNPSSDPWNPDTDGDGFTDFEELNGIQVSGGQTSWVRRFETAVDYYWYVEQSDENNIFGLSTEKYVSSPFSLYLETTSGGHAYGISPALDIDLAQDYSISFYFRLAGDTNDWLEVLMNGHIRLVIDSSNNLCYMYNGLLNDIITLNSHQWYYIKCEVTPSLSMYKVYIDDILKDNSIPFFDNFGMNELHFSSPIDGQTTIGSAYWDNIFVSYTTTSKRSTP